MKRFWPLAFLILLFAALVARPTPRPMKLTVHGPWIFTDPVPQTEPMVPAPPLVVDAVPKPEAAPEPPEETGDALFKRSAVGAGLLWLATHQNEDGSWGDLPVTVGGRTIGRTGVTSLALLSFFGAGYSHLSRDEYNGDKKIGDMDKRALQWMQKDQREDGTFQSGYDVGFDQVLATLATSEAYGMTASKYLKEPAEKAVEAMLRMQGTDGSWGCPEVTAWAIHALFSAELSELPSPRAVHEQALQYIDRNPHPGNALSRILLTKRRDSAAEEATALVSAPPQGDSQDFCDWFHFAHSVFHFDGPEGSLWKKANDPMKRTIVPLQQKDGSWQGGTLSHTVARTSLAELTLQVYYRYANPVVSAK